MFKRQLKSGNKRVGAHLPGQPQGQPPPPGLSAAGLSHQAAAQGQQRPQGANRGRDQALAAFKGLVSGCHVKLPDCEEPAPPLAKQAAFAAEAAAATAGPAQDAAPSAHHALQCAPVAKLWPQALKHAVSVFRQHLTPLMTGDNDCAQRLPALGVHAQQQLEAASSQLVASCKGVSQLQPHEREQIVSMCCMCWVSGSFARCVGASAATAGNGQGISV